MLQTEEIVKVRLLLNEGITFANNSYWVAEGFKIISSLDEASQKSHFFHVLLLILSGGCRLKVAKKQ